MKHSAVSISFLLFLLVAGTCAQERRFGLGVILGEPTGLSGKFWVSPVHAFDFGLGWSVQGDWINYKHTVYNGESSVHFHVDYLWHWFDAFSSSKRLPLYSGIGGRINTYPGHTSSAAVRGVLGIAWMPYDTPIDFFIEIAPFLQAIPFTDFGIDGGLGVRFYF